MKIFRNDAVYVQKNDIAYLNNTDLSIPASIFMKVFGSGIVIIDDSNRYDFIDFTEPKDIEFFSSLDWIFDYDDVMDLSEEEIMDLGNSIAEKRNEIVNEFSSMDKNEKEKNLSMIQQCDLLEFKLLSLRDFLWFKQGHIKIELPDGVGYPSGTPCF